MAPGLLSSGKHLGSLGIDLNGLDISGTVDAAYYRAGTPVPGSVLMATASAPPMRLTHPLIPVKQLNQTQKHRCPGKPQQRHQLDQASESEEIIADQTTEEIARMRPLMSTPSSPPAPLK